MYKVEHNACRCHPETCACNPWRVVDAKGEHLSTHYDKAAADKLAALLNAANQGPNGG